MIKPVHEKIFKELKSKGLNPKVIKKILNSKRKHSDFSASGSERWLNCSGSVALSKKVKPSEDSFYSVEGSIAHYYLEKWLLKILAGEKWNARKAINYEDMYFAVKRAVDKILEDLEPHEVLRTETKVSLSFIHPTMFGTSDIIVYDPRYRVLKVKDYKHGKWLVNPERNTQLIFYALGAAKEIGFSKTDFIELGILQPRAIEDVQRTSIMTMKEVLGYAEIFAHGVNKALSKKGMNEFNMGSWCHWCPAKDICPLREKIENEKIKDFFNKQ